MAIQAGPGIRNINTNESVSLEGIDDIYEESLTAATSDTGKAKMIELPINQAAQALGISERTLWRRVESGKVKSRMKGTKRMIRVPVTKLIGVPDSAIDKNDTLPVGHVGTIVDLKALMAELTAAHYRVGYLQSKVEVQGEQLKLLPDFQAQAATAQVYEEKVKQLEAELGQIKATWWYRFCAWLTGSGV